MIWLLNTVSYRFLLPCSLLIIIVVLDRYTAIALNVNQFMQANLKAQAKLMNEGMIELIDDWLTGLLACWLVGLLAC